MDLATFRATWPPREYLHDGDTWEFVRAGEGLRRLLILPGALGFAEASWKTIERYAAPNAQPRCDVITPTYPASISTMGRLADGIAALLDGQEMGTVSVFGASYGGLVAQSFARRHPHRVERLVLSHTGAPEPARAQRSPRSLGLLRRLPEPILKSMYRRQFTRALREIDRDDARPYIDHMEALISQRSTRESIVNTLLRVADFDGTWESQPNVPFTGPTLLLFGALDRATPPEARQGLQALYPQAETEVFQESGHATAITHADLYYARVARFLA